MPDIDRLGPTQRPTARATGAQNWWELSFLHWRVPVEELRPLVPEPLVIDEFDGSAWVALVPFRMTGVRPWRAFPVPGLSSFRETNVRTYVHLDGRNPGVWFGSLDASNAIAVRIARRFWHLNYQFARMQLYRDGDAITYESERYWPGHPGAGGRVAVRIGEPIEHRGAGGPGTAEPGTLEHFLVERYLLYTLDPRGRLLMGRVHHTPYPLRTAECTEIEDSLLSAAGIDVGGRPPDHVLFSEGVRVHVFPLKPVTDHTP